MSESLPPDRDAEQEVDFGRVWGALVARWWLLVVGLFAGALVGYLVAVGGSTVYRAAAVVYLGQPLSPSGGSQVQTLQTNPSTVRVITRSESVLHRVAAAAGMSPSQLRGHITVTPVAGAIAKLGQTPLVQIGVSGSSPREVARAANLLAQIAAENVSGYVAVKLRTLSEQIAQSQAELAAIDARLAAADKAAKAGSASDRLLVLTSSALTEQRRSIVLQDLTQAQQLLALAKSVEASSVVTHATAVKQTARTARNSTVVGALVGLLLGLLAALVWEPVARRGARRPAV